MDQTLVKNVWQLVEPLVKSEGYEVVEIECQGGKNGLVRVYLDSAPGEAHTGISIDKCAEFSRRISAELDANDPFEHPYMLEVSSPGVERPLRVPAQFARFIGKQVSAKVMADGRPKKVSGTLVAANEAVFTLQPAAAATPKKNANNSPTAPVSVETVSIAYVDLHSAHLVYDFNAAFASGPGQKPGKGRSANQRG